MSNKKLIKLMKEEAAKSPCKVIKFSASNGRIFSYNGEFYADCENCKRVRIEQSYPQCKANHAEWGLLAKLKDEDCEEIYIYCMTPDGIDYPFERFWCLICSMLIPMFGIKDIYMWNNERVHHNSQDLIKEVTNSD